MKLTYESFDEILMNEVRQIINEQNNAYRECKELLEHLIDE